MFLLQDEFDDVFNHIFIGFFALVNFFTILMLDADFYCRTSVTQSNVVSILIRFWDSSIYICSKFYHLLNFRIEM